MTNSLQQIKDGVASDFGQRDWRTADWNDSISEVMIDQIAIRYAQEQNKELVEMLEILNMEGGLGHVRHERIRNLINKHKTGQQ